METHENRDGDECQEILIILNKTAVDNATMKKKLLKLVSSYVNEVYSKGEDSELEEEKITLNYDQEVLQTDKEEKNRIVSNCKKCHRRLLKD